MPTASLSDLVVEVLHNRGDDKHPDWSVGSGYLVGAHLVLTAAHNVDGPGLVLVRVHGTEEYLAEVCLLGDRDHVDLALLEVPTSSETVPPLRYAVVDRTAAARVEPCRAVGFPQLKVRAQKPKAQRFSAQVDGYIPTGDNLDRPQLTLLITRSPRPVSSSTHAESEWAGMSGAVVFAGDNIVVGVVAEHHLPEGESALTVVPITALDQLPNTEAAKWWQLLGVERGALVSLPDRVGGASSAAINLTVAEEKYRHQVIEAYRTLRFSGFEQSDLFLDEVPLEQVFVQLRLLVEQVRRVQEEPEEERGRARGRGGGRDQRPQERVVTVLEPITLAQALKKPLLLVGEPGAGKSTLLRWLAVTFAQGTQRAPERMGPEAATDRLPVLIEPGNMPGEYLQGDGGQTPNWQELIPTLLTRQQRFTGMPPSLIQQALDDGRCLLLFDGLDEIANRQARARIARSLAELLRLWPGASIVIGSRPAGLGEGESVLRPTFQRCEIQRFTPEDLHRFFRFWYALDGALSAEQQEAAAATLFTQLQAIPGTLSLATTPLLATILLLIWRREGSLPERRTDLYEHCCRALVEAWEHGHDVQDPGSLTHLDWEQHLRLLEPIAYAIHQKEQRTAIRRQDILPLLERSLLDAKLSADVVVAVQHARDLLKELGLRSGLLQYLGDEQYGFPHLTFQEYLAARHIAAQPDPTHLDMLLEHLHEAWWQEVHLLTIGVLGSGTNEGSRKASTVLLTILHLYHSPMRLLRVSPLWMVRFLSPGKWLPRIQLSRRLAWLLRREGQFALWALDECAPDGVLHQVRQEVREYASQTVQAILKDPLRRGMLHEWLNMPGHPLGESERQRLAIPLLEALRAAHWYIRRTAAEGLGQVGVGQPVVVEALLAALRDVSADVCAAAAESLGQVGVGQPVVVEALLAALADGNASERQWAVMVLGQVGVGQPAVVEPLLAALADAGRGLRQEAVRVLGQVGVEQQVAEALLLALSDADEDLRQAAIGVLERMGLGQPVVVEALLTALRVPNASQGMRQAAADILGRIGVGQPRVVEALLAVLPDANERVRWSAAKSLGQVGIGQPGVVKALLVALHDPDWMVRRAAAKSLGQVGIGQPGVVEELLVALRDADGTVREAAAGGLGQVGIGQPGVVEALLLALHDPDGFVYLTAAESLGQLSVGQPVVVEALLASLRDAHMTVRHAAAKSLGQVGIGQPGVVEALLASLRDADEYVRQAAAESLGQVGIEQPDVVKALLVALRDTDEDVRQAAAESLGRAQIKDPRQLSLMLGALNQRLYALVEDECEKALDGIRQLVKGRSLPDSPLLLVQRHRANRQRLSRIAIWLLGGTLVLAVGLVGTWLTGLLDTSNVLWRFLGVITVVIAFAAGVAQVLGWSFRDFREQRKRRKQRQ